MTNPAPAVEDTNWLDDAGELYLQAGSSVERDRPIYQGDVFAGVPVIRLPKNPPAGSVVECPIETGAVMVVPHPCQCYYGDRLRPYLTVAPIKIVENYDNFGEDHAGAKDKFALLDLPLPGSSDGNWTAQSCVADRGRMFSVPGRWLKLESRAACLTHEGIGLLDIIVSRSAAVGVARGRRSRSAAAAPAASSSQLVSTDCETRNRQAVSLDRPRFAWPRAREHRGICRLPPGRIPNTYAASNTAAYIMPEVTVSAVISP